MRVADPQLLIDYSDVAIRAAAQLQLFKRGRAIRDYKVLERAVEFLNAAAAGGSFMSSGNSANLHVTLLPLNWAADAWIAIIGESEEVNYSDLTQFLQRTRVTMEKVLTKSQPDNEAVEECIAFLDRLGYTLGMRADQMLK